MKNHLSTAPESREAKRRPDAPDHALRPWLVWIVVGVAVLVRLPGVLQDAFSQDEVASARVLIESSPIGVLRHVARTEATPPLWYMLGWLGHSIGISPGGYRWLSLVAGAAAAGLTTLFAQRILSPLMSCAAGLMTALAWELVMHGRELRAYAAFSFLAVCFALVLRKAWAEPSRSSRVWLATIVAAGTLTNYFFALTVLAGFVWLWTEPAVRSVARRLTPAIAFGLIPLAVWSPVLIHQYRGQRFAWIGPFNVGRLLDSLWLLFVHHVPSIHPLNRHVVPALFLVSILVGLALLAPRSPDARLCAWLGLMPFVLVMLFWAGGAHVFIARNLVGIAPFLTIGLVGIISHIARPVNLVVALAAVAAFAVGTIRAEATPPTPYDRVAHQLVRLGWQRSDPIVLRGDFFSFRSPLEWYLPGKPTLTLGLPNNERCTSVYVVAEGRRNRTQLRRSGLLADSHVIGNVEVGRLLVNRLPTISSVSLAVRGSGPTCVRLVPEARLVAELHRLRRPKA